MFKTAYNVKNHVSGEDYTRVKSKTQPEQVVPLNRIIEGLKNGSIILDGNPQHFDIAEHEINVFAGRTPEETNAIIAAATAADLAESAAKAGDVITAHPGFQIEDAQPTVDAIEAAIANADVDGEQAAAPQSQAAEKPKTEALTGSAEDGKAATAPVNN